MKDVTFDKKLALLKKRLKQAERNVVKYTALCEKWQKEVDSVNGEIYELNGKHSQLSAEQVTEAIAMYKKMKEQKEQENTAKLQESAKDSETTRPETHNNNMGNPNNYGGNR